MRATLTIVLTITLGLLVVTAAAKEAGSKRLKTGDVVLRMSGFENDEGKPRCAMFTRNTYLKKAPHGTIAAIKGRKALCVLKDVPYGIYAIAAFHDEDGDTELDTGLFGIPTEDGCFSNNASGTFGPASWDDAKFKHARPRTVKHCHLD